jgi:hypothetical protein
MTPEKTVRMVLLSELTDLARLGAAMRRAQRDFFERKRQQPHVAHTPEFEAVRSLERRFDAACREALAREQVPLPGMEEGGELPAV